MQIILYWDMQMSKKAYATDERQVSSEMLLWM